MKTKTRDMFLGAMVLMSTSGLRAVDVVSLDAPIDLEQVTLGSAAFNGSGCRPGTVFPLLDRESQELILIFDDYYVEAEGAKKVARKNCALAIPLHLPQGIGVTLVSQRISGFNLLPDGASTVLTSETFLAGSSGAEVSTRFDGSLEEEFLVDGLTVAESEVPDACGTDVNLRVNTSLRVKTNAYGDYAGAAITAMGESAKGLVLRMKFSHCE